MTVRAWVNASAGPVRRLRQRFVTMQKLASVELAKAGDPEARAVFEADLDEGIWDEIFRYWMAERGHLAR